MGAAEDYRKLLMEVAQGSGDVYGYANLEGKTSDEFREAVDEYRERMVDEDRTDFFIVPDDSENIELVEEHFSDERLRKHFEARFIPEDLVDVNCDFYLWDGKVGIASFEDGELRVRIDEDPAFFEMYKQFFDSLWGLAQRKEVFYGAQTSEMTRLEKELYLNPDEYLNLAEGYPRDINPEWVQEERGNPGLEDSDSKELIALVKDYFADIMNSENVILTPTATDALVLATDTVIDTPRDEVIAFDPGYDAYPNIVRSFGGNLIYAERDADYSLDIGDLKDRITDRTVAVAITNPENPLGKIYSEKKIREIAEVCRENGLSLIMDSAHIQATSFDKEVPRLSDLEELSYLQIGDTGKILGLDGSKIGCISYSEDLGKKLEDRANNYFFQLNKYDLKVISEIVHHERFDEFKQNYLQVIRENYRYLEQNLDKKIEVMPLEDSTVALIDIEKTDLKDKEFCQKLMEEKSLGLVPASYFYGTSQKEERYVRIALARPREYIEETVRKINELVR